MPLADFSCFSLPLRFAVSLPTLAAVCLLPAAVEGRSFASSASDRLLLAVVVVEDFLPLAAGPFRLLLVPGATVGFLGLTASCCLTAADTDFLLLRPAAPLAAGVGGTTEVSFASSWLLWLLLLESLSLSDEDPDEDDDEDELDDSDTDRAGPLSRKGNTSCLTVRWAGCGGCFALPDGTAAVVAFERLLAVAGFLPTGPVAASSFFFF